MEWISLLSRKVEKKTQKDKKKLKPKKVEEKEMKPQEEVGQDFGGLPQRDLKKNLGCG